jgi:hypothetical protein
MIASLSSNAVIEILQSAFGVVAALWVAVLIAMRAPAYQRPAWAVVGVLLVEAAATVTYRLTFRWFIDNTDDLTIAMVNVVINLTWAACRIGVLALAVVSCVAAAQGTAPPLGYAPARVSGT